MVFGWLWIALIVATSLVTVLSGKNIYVAFAAGSVLPIIFDIFSLDLIWQIIAFFVVSCVYIYVAYKYFDLGDKVGIEDMSSLVGKKCIVDEVINNAAGSGQVVVMGLAWSARAVVDGEIYEKGKVLTVVAVEGVKLICRA